MQAETAFTIERTFKADTSKVWHAITNKEAMKHWYFDFKEFKPEIGFEFQFYGGTEENQYLHLCKVTEVIPEKKLSYSWRYDGYPGISYVTFELFDEGEQTKLRLTHSGLESFPADQPDFARKNFEAGWNDIIGNSLKAFLEK
jgi:uncharacterized protein YndB with AHSA1/START domain